MLTNEQENPIVYRPIYRPIYRPTIISAGFDNRIWCGVDPHHNVARLAWIDGILGLGAAVLAALPNDLINAAPPGLDLASQVDAPSNRRIRRT